MHSYHELCDLGSMDVRVDHVLGRDSSCKYAKYEYTGSKSSVYLWCYWILVTYLVTFMCCRSSAAKSGLATARVVDASELGKHVSPSQYVSSDGPRRYSRKYIDPRLA